MLREPWWHCKPSACKLNAFGQASGHFPRIAINPVEGSSSSYLISRGRTGYSNDESATILLPSQRLKTSLFTNRCLAPLNQKLQEHLRSNFLKETRQVVFFCNHQLYSVLKDMRFWVSMLLEDLSANSKSGKANHSF